MSSGLHLRSLRVLTTHCAFLPLEDYHVSPLSSRSVGGSAVGRHGFRAQIAGVNLILCQPESEESPTKPGPEADWGVAAMLQEWSD